MSNIKVCKRCKEPKNELTDFYMCGGYYRSECKKCTVERNVSYQRRVRAWQHRNGNEEGRKIYMKSYYESHKEQYAEYRHEFKKRNPEYYKFYFRARKEKV